MPICLSPHFSPQNTGWIRTLNMGKTLLFYYHSSVGIALGYGPDSWVPKVQFLAGAGNFSLHHCIQNSSEVHPASYPMGTRALSLGVKWPGCEADH
jgi:hypothetical protein